MLPTPVGTNRLLRYRHSALLRIGAKPTVNACSQKQANYAQDSVNGGRCHHRCLSGMAKSIRREAATLTSLNRSMIPKEACSGFDPGWKPVFGKDRAQTKS